jgi:hypothetical protein
MIKFTNIRQSMLKLKTHSMIYFDSDMSKSTNTVVYFDWKTVIYIHLHIRCFVYNGPFVIFNKNVIDIVYRL